MESKKIGVKRTSGGGAAGTGTKEQITKVANPVVSEVGEKKTQNQYEGGRGKKEGERQSWSGKKTRGIQLRGIKTGECVSVKVENQKGACGEAEGAGIWNPQCRSWKNRAKGKELNRNSGARATRKNEGRSQNNRKQSPKHSVGAKWRDRGSLTQVD